MAANTSNRAVHRFIGRY